MELTLSQVAKLFDVPEQTVAAWVRDESLPSQFVNDQYRFDRSELLEWSALKKKNCPPRLFQDVNGDSIGALSLADAIENGGVLDSVKGDDKSAVLSAAIADIPLPESFDRRNLLDLLLARESLCSTGVGDGIAIPHPRFPVVLALPRPAVRLCYLARPVEFAANDDKPVDKLFVMICPTVHCHLQLLALLAIALRDEGFRAVINARRDRQSVVNAARMIEHTLHP